MRVCVCVWDIVFLLSWHWRSVTLFCVYAFMWHNKWVSANDNDTNRCLIRDHQNNIFFILPNISNSISNTDSSFSIIKWIKYKRSNLLECTVELCNHNSIILLMTPAWETTYTVWAIPCSQWWPCFFFLFKFSLNTRILKRKNGKKNKKKNTYII